MMSKVNVDAFAHSASGSFNAATQNLSPNYTDDLGGFIPLNSETNIARLCLWVLGGFNVSDTGTPTTIPFFLGLPPDGLTDSPQGLCCWFDTTLRDDYCISGSNRTLNDPQVVDMFRSEWRDFQLVAPPEDDKPC